MLGYLSLRLTDFVAGRGIMGWLKIKSAAKYCDMSDRSLRRWLKEGLRHVRTRSGTVLIKRLWLDEYLEQFEVTENQVEKIVNDVLAEM